MTLTDTMMTVMMMMMMMMVVMMMVMVMSTVLPCDGSFDTVRVSRCLSPPPSSASLTRFFGGELFSRTKYHRHMYVLSPQLS